MYICVRKSNPEITDIGCPEYALVLTKQGCLLCQGRRWQYWIPSMVQRPDALYYPEHMMTMVNPTLLHWPSDPR
jgi:hypothetical protein